MKKALRPILVLCLAAGCGGAPDGEADAAPEGASAQAAVASVTLLSPEEGEEIMGTSVTVRLETSNLPIVPAGDLTPGTGHHHLFLDADLTDAAVPVPTVPGSIVHMGDASAAYTFEGVSPGEHVLIAVVADGVHVPHQPWVVDTVRFVVH